ncbi:MAG: cupin domain-containing protein [Bacteriovoracaceae bacterium]
MTAEEVIQKLNLVPLPLEGGFFRETFRSPRYVESDIGRKSECTAIYYLVTEKSFSLLHTVDQEEIFHFYAGSPVKMLQIIDAKAVYITLGNDLSQDHHPQVVVPRGIWQGTKLVNPFPGAWALLGCTVAPGFEYENFHMKSRKDLTDMYPSLALHIADFTYSD